MKICFSTLGCPEWSFSEVISVASDLGYNGIEIRGIKRELYAPDIEHFASDTQLRAVKEQLKRLSLEIPCLTSSCNLNIEGDIEKAKAYVDTASSLGAPYIRLLGDPSPEPSGDVSLKIIMPHLLEVASYAQDKGVTPLIETNGFFAKTKTLGAMFKDLGDANVGILYDIHHPYRFFREEPAYTINNIGPYIKHVHIKDSIQKDKQIKYKMVGEGTMPVKETIRLLKDFGYNGYYSLEWVKRWDFTLEEPGIAFAHFKNFMDLINS